ncbi:RNA polymerase [Aeromonas phage avDM11-UST]|nr:RNA polymerase [Aeromonas phage avDM11-UST]
MLVCGLVVLERQNAGVVGADAETLSLAAEYADAIATRAGALAGISPMYQPCVVPPKPWTTVTGPHGKSTRRCWR